MGARPPRGILMVGPPGTGKTLLAKGLWQGRAMSPSSPQTVQNLWRCMPALPLLASGDLFLSARRIAPAIIFIDEIDAIGEGERGQGWEMRGRRSGAGAAADAALAGRQLQNVHVSVREITGSIVILNPAIHGEVWDDKINMDHIVEAMDKAKLGLATTPMADSPAKRRMATVVAGQAVVAALTPGMPQLEAVSIFPRGNVPARLDFKPQEALSWARRLYPEEGKTLKVNAVEIKEPPSLLELCAGMLMPQYAARATEEALYGRRGVTITTAKGVAIAGRLAYWLVAHSNLDPRFNRTPLGQGMRPGGRTDPVTAKSTPRFEAAVVRLQQAAYVRTLRLVRVHRAAIEQIAAELCQGRETVQGSRVVEIVDTCKQDQASTGTGGAVGAFSDHFATQVGQPGAATFGRFGGIGRSGAAGMRPQPSPMDQVWSSVDISEDMLRVAAEAVVGRVDIEELLGDTLPKYLADELKEQLDDREVAQRLAYAQSFAKSARPTSALDFPPAPSLVPEYKGTGLGAWMPAEPEVISVGSS
ncbi:hypothetical protein WJX84_006740 [Apatococcus fuscideae]|uniref:ATPase AAA-type core domain-containing protein n=1 Tax=Apatococcus fuscideae TaxID=2026836 RepID=A0AAW1TDQ0_9CHLO